MNIKSEYMVASVPTLWTRVGFDTSNRKNQNSFGRIRPASFENPAFPTLIMVSVRILQGAVIEHPATGEWPYFLEIAVSNKQIEIDPNHRNHGQHSNIILSGQEDWKSSNKHVGFSLKIALPLLPIKFHVVTIKDEALPSFFTEKKADTKNQTHFRVLVEILLKNWQVD